MKTVWIAGGVVLLLILIVALVAPLLFLPRGGGYGWGMMGPWMSGGWSMMGMMFIGPLLLLVVVVLCVVGAVWFAQSAARGGPPAVTFKTPGETPLDILKRRYAGGEITQQQFDEMRRALES